MKNWLKKITKQEIIQMLKKDFNKKFYYKLPERIDKKVKSWIYIEGKTMADKSKQKTFISGKLKYALASICAIIFLITVFSVVYILNNVPNTTISENIESEVTEEVSYDEAVVTFTSGDVLVKKNSDWDYLEAGDYVYIDQLIRVEKDSYCELQFGNTAIIIIQENTEVAMESIYIKQEQSDIGLNLATGSVLCKVERLTDKERFEVKTKMAICGVRGTEFKVSYSEQTGSKLEVNKGKVVVLPPAIDIKKINQKLSKKGENILKIIKQIDESVPVLETNQAIILTKKISNIAIELLNEKIDQIAEKAQVEDKDIQELETMVKDITEEHASITEVKADISEESREDFNTLEKTQMIELEYISPVSVDKQIKGEQEEEKEVITIEIDLVKVFIKVSPLDAEIFLGDEYLGKGNFSGLFNDQDELSLKIQKEGYKSELLDIKVTKTKENVYTAELKKIAEEKTEPASLLKDDTKPQDQTEAIKKGPVEKILSLSTKPIINGFAFSGSTIVAADGVGKITAFTSQGNILWRVATKNTPNDNSHPVIIGNKVCFSGGKELVTLSLNRGSFIKRLNLDVSASHIFGQRIAMYNDKGLFPTDKSIRIMDLDSGNMIKELNIPDGTKMTPMVYNGHIYIVNQNGVLYIFDPAGDDKPQYSIKTNSVQPISITLSVYNDKAYFTGRKGLVVCVDLKQNNVTWQKELVPGKSAIVLHDIECGAEGAFVFTEDTIYGYSLDNGNELFKPLQGVSSPPLYDNGLLYFGTAGGNLIVMDAKTGTTEKSLYLEKIIAARPLLIENKLFVGTEGGKVIVINPDEF